MKYQLSLFLFLSASSYLSAQGLYDVNKIPEELKKEAVAVVRNEEQFFDVKSLGSAQYDYKIAITIFNKAGDDLAEMVKVYDKFSPISNIKATLYDASGKKIKDYKSSDIKDQSLISDFSIYEDNRLKFLKFVSVTYPYTIEYSLSQEFKGFIAFLAFTKFFLSAHLHAKRINGRCAKAQRGSNMVGRDNLPTLHHQ